MVDFSYQIINQIRSARDNDHVKTIVEDSLDTLIAKKGIFNSKRKYMMNMVMALRYVKAEELDAKACSNVNYAIEVFEALRRADNSHLF